MSNKKYLFLSSAILILVIILVLTIFLKNRGYSLPTLKKINSGISEIIIKRGADESLSIKLTNNKWTINDKYNADASIIENMTNVLNFVQPVEIISRGDEEQKERYRLLEGEVLSVIALDSSSKEVRNIRFGMKSTLRNNVYAQINNDKNIYLLGNTSSNPKDVFDKSESDIINKTISSIRNDDIEKIYIFYNDKIYDLEKSKEDSSNWIKVWDNNSLISINDLYSPVYTIANFKADDLIRNDSDKNTVLYKIEIYTDSETISYEILNKSENNGYEVVLTGDNNRYYVSETAFNNLKEAIEDIIF